MKYRDFEIRKHNAPVDDGRTNKPRYELVKWFKRDNGEPPYCIVIAFITYNAKEPCWEFQSVGMRFIDYFETGLDEYVRNYIHILDLIWQDVDKGE